MGNKFHINSNGIPAECHATTRPCPLGGAESHFDTIEAAQAAADKNNQAKYGTLAAHNESAPKKFGSAEFQYELIHQDKSVVLRSNDKAEIDAAAEKLKAEGIRSYAAETDEYINSRYKAVLEDQEVGEAYIKKAVVRAIESEFSSRDIPEDEFSGEIGSLADSVMKEDIARCISALSDEDLEYDIADLTEEVVANDEDIQWAIKDLISDVEPGYIAGQEREAEQEYRAQMAHWEADQRG